MNMKLIGLLIGAVIILLGLVAVMMGGKTEQPAPVANTAPVAIEKPRSDPRRGSFKKSDPGKYEYTTPR
jgi:hypothetical protein